MRILWIYPALPYPLTSGFLRGYHLLKHLGERHAITFVCLTTLAEVPPESMLALSPLAEEIKLVRAGDLSTLGWLTIFPLRSSVGLKLEQQWTMRRAVKRLRKSVDDALKTGTFDLVIFSGRETFPVLKELHLPIVVECGDTNSARTLQEMHHAAPGRRHRLLLHYLFSRHLERRIARRSPHRCFISARDRENLLGREDRSAIVPQGVDCSYWRRVSVRCRSNTIVFSGVMNYAPNVDAALFLVQRVLPILRRTLPNLSLQIVGRDPARELIELTRGLPSVSLTGEVDDLRPYLERADIFVAPLRFASGVQNKILEAMSMELPIVTTPIVAAGLQFYGRTPELVVGCTAEKLASGALRLLSNPNEADRLAANGRSFVEANCSWQRSAEALEELCFAAVGRQTGHASSDGDALVHPRFTNGFPRRT